MLLQALHIISDKLTPQKDLATLQDCAEKRDKKYNWRNVASSESGEKDQGSAFTLCVEKSSPHL